MYDLSNVKAIVLISYLIRFLRNALLARRQMVVDVLHPTRPNVSKDELRERLAALYKADKDSVSVFGFRTQFGGGKSTGFALIYDSPEDLKKFEPAYRLIRIGQATKVEKASRQQRKQKKNRKFLSRFSQNLDRLTLEIYRRQEGSGNWQETGQADIELSLGLREKAFGLYICCGFVLSV